jgi:hypothetical protein
VTVAAARPPASAARASARVAPTQRLAVLAIAVAATAGCSSLVATPATASGGDVEPAPGQSAVQGTDREIRRGVVAATPGRDVGVEAIVAAVRADAAQALGLADGGAALTLAVEAVTWGDGSLGCPQPGMRYTQALVPGWRVVVRDGAREWVYHASRRGAWLWCPPGLAHAPPPGAAVR